VAKALAARNVRALFLSDIHLGTKGCQAELLIALLREVEAETIYLVGDIIDGWRLRTSWYWPQAHNDVVQKLLRKVRKGTRIIYIPGNHDEFLRDYHPLSLGGIEFAEHAIHESASGRRYLVIHGDHFDLVVKHARWLAHLGDWAYALALGANTYLNIVRRRLGLSYWSLSAWAKARVKDAVNYIGEFETALAGEARRRQADGVICGHIHRVSDRTIDGIHYLNTGDWVESCTAIVETHDGTFEIIDFPDSLRNRAGSTSAATAGRGRIAA
jgi:UDP-2,3-diacylglucosamine pyrophosphatase LpxH